MWERRPRRDRLPLRERDRGRGRRSCNRDCKATATTINNNPRLAPVWLPLLTAVSACLAILGKYRGPGPLVYLFKPLTTVLILLLALLASPPVTPAYQWLIVLGLLFSLAGDVFLMLPRDRFVAGLVSFLIAHLFYIAAFAQQADGTPALPGLLVFAVFS